MKLSILIPTLPHRAHLLARMRSYLDPQIIGKPVEILTDAAPANVPTGTKRNNLITRASGEYVVCIDDDDYVTPDYVELILDALTKNPDCVTFCGWMTTNGGSRVDWVIKLGEKYEERNGKYYRFPNHLCPIKKHIAALIKFNPVHQGEDYQWAKVLHDHNMLNSEVHIEKQIYHYDFKTVK